MSPSELQQLESLLARVLPDPRRFGNKVLEQLLDRLVAQSPAARPGTVVQATAEARSDRNIVLAAALGACECWGHDPACALCGGAGSSGWTEPDEDLYTEYVRPAVQRELSGGGPASISSRPNPDGAAGGRPR